MTLADDDLEPDAETDPEEELEVLEDETEEMIPVEDVLDGEDETEPPLVYDEESPNLVEAFKASVKGSEWLDDLASRVVEDWDRGWEASSRRRKQFEEDWKIFAGELEALKAPPYEFCANAHVPIMIENVLRVTTRATGELFGDWNTVFGVTPLGPEDSTSAEILTTHGNWQIREQIPDFKRQVAHRGVLAFFTIGDITARSYYDTRTRLNCHEILTPDDFVTPYVYVTTKPDYGDCPWYAFKFLRYRHELEAEAGNWYDVGGLLGRKPSLSDEPDAPITEGITRIQGEDKDDQEPAAPYKLIWWEGWQSIPPSDDQEPDLLPEPLEAGVESPEPRQRWLKVIIDYVSKHVLHVSIHEMANWQEKERFRMQKSELDAFRAAEQEHQGIVTAHSDSVAAQQMAISEAQSGPGLGEMQLAEAQRALQALASQPLPPPPPPPAWLTDPEDPMAGPEPPRKEPILLFSHGVCIEPLVGNLGLSYGKMEADTNRAANVVLSQFIDSATLANIKTFLVSGTVSSKEPLKLRPGEFNFMKDLPQNIKEALLPIAFDPANPQMIEVLDLMIKFGQQAMQSPEVLSGAPGKSGETYRGLAARIEQATKQLSVLTGKYADFLKQILRNNALLNSMFLRDEELYFITNHITGQASNIKVSRAMYERNYLVEIRADLRFTSMAQKVAEADEIVQMSMSVPVLAQNPDFQWMAAKKSLEARGRYDMAQLMGDPPSVAYQKAVAAAQAAGMPPPLPPGSQQPQQQQGKPQSGGKPAGGPPKKMQRVTGGAGGQPAAGPPTEMGQPPP